VAVFLHLAWYRGGRSSAAGKEIDDTLEDAQGDRRVNRFGTWGKYKRGLEDDCLIVQYLPRAHAPLTPRAAAGPKVAIARPAQALLADLRHIPLELRIVHIARRVEVQIARVGDFVLQALVQERK